jgi:hypothetical protein
MQIKHCDDWTQLNLQTSLQERQASLLAKQQQVNLSNEEDIELEAIQELAAIVAYINHQMAYQTRNCLK